mmetsp:Transcript_279/g.800  ORF Transcript_279/g.800 Transcript_279/m.800 type:complete len:198 (-) Transcript_279:156-749(-)
MATTADGASPRGAAAAIASTGGARDVLVGVTTREGMLTAGPMAGAGGMEGDVETMSGFQLVRQYGQDNPLKVSVGLWAAVMVTTLTWVTIKKRHLPLSMRVIHARLVAQAAVLSGVCTAGLMNVLAGGSANGVDARSAQQAQLEALYDRPEFARFNRSAKLDFSHAEDATRSTMGTGAAAAAADSEELAPATSGRTI